MFAGPGNRVVRSPAQVVIRQSFEQPIARVFRPGFVRLPSVRLVQQVRAGLPDTDLLADMATLTCSGQLVKQINSLALCHWRETAQ